MYITQSAARDCINYNSKQKLAFALFRQIIALALIITRYYVLLQKFLLCRTPGGSMANWEHEEGVSQRLAELKSTHHIRESFPETAKEEYEGYHSGHE